MTPHDLLADLASIAAALAQPRLVVVRDVVDAEFHVVATLHRGTIFITPTPHDSPSRESPTGDSP